MTRKFIISDGNGNYYFHKIPDQKVFLTKDITRATTWSTYPEAQEGLPSILPLIGDVAVIQEIYITD